MMSGGEAEMTRNFDNRKDLGHQDSSNMDSMQRDRFELLSAYLDGEVTATESKQVQEWLATDPEVQNQYSRLLKLRQGWQSLSVPVSAQSTQQLTQKVFDRIDQRRSRKGLAWGGAAIAALVIGAVSTILPGTQSPVPQFAQAPQPAVKTTKQPLMVALNRPVVEIPKAPEEVPEKVIKQSTTRHNP
jgi:anti-sigma factor RsiW